MWWRKLLGYFLSKSVVRIIDFDGEVTYRLVRKGAMGSLMVLRMFPDIYVTLLPGGETRGRSYVKRWETLKNVWP